MSPDGSTIKIIMVSTIESGYIARSFSFRLLFCTAVKNRGWSNQTPCRHPSTTSIHQLHLSTTVHPSIHYIHLLHPSTISSHLLHPSIYYIATTAINTLHPSTISLLHPSSHYIHLLLHPSTISLLHPSIHYINHIHQSTTSIYLLHPSIYNIYPSIHPLHPPTTLLSPIICFHVSQIKSNCTADKGEEQGDDDELGPVQNTTVHTLI